MLQKDFKINTKMHNDCFLFSLETSAIRNLSRCRCYLVYFRQLDLSKADTQLLCSGATQVIQEHLNRP